MISFIDYFKTVRGQFIPVMKEEMNSTKYKNIENYIKKIYPSMFLELNNEYHNQSLVFS